MHIGASTRMQFLAHLEGTYGIAHHGAIRGNMRFKFAP